MRFLIRLLNRILGAPKRRFQGLLLLPFDGCRTSDEFVAHRDAFDLSWKSSRPTPKRRYTKQWWSGTQPEYWAKKDVVPFDEFWGPTTFEE